MKLSKFNKELKKEFDSTFQEEIEIKETISLKKILIPIISIASLVILLAGFLIGEHIGVNIYNDRVQKEYDEYYNEYYQNYTDDNLFNLEDNSLIKIKSEKEYNVLNKTKNYTKKESIIDNIISIFDKNSSKDLGLALPGAGLPDYSVNASVATTTIPASTPEISEGTNSSIDTNIQVEGIDEADIAKCDGMYIYYYSNYNLYIYEKSLPDLVARYEHGLLHDFM
ncbi:MAG: beta-propeller domain-containing protein [Acholeplasmatales bacterium]|nr:beta-propeller domain-containing protein [Acholeplasmatales bacterium]